MEHPAQLRAVWRDHALKLMSRVAPQFILRQLSKSADNMLSQSKSQS